MITNNQNITGCMVTMGGKLGIVTDGIPRVAGKNLGRVAVMWLGGNWPVREERSELTILDMPAGGA